MAYQKINDNSFLGYQKHLLPVLFQESGLMSTCIRACYLPFNAHHLMHPRTFAVVSLRWPLQSRFHTEHHFDDLLTCCFNVQELKNNKKETSKTFCLKSAPIWLAIVSKLVVSNVVYNEIYVSASICDGSLHSLILLLNRIALVHAQLQEYELCTYPLYRKVPQVKTIGKE